MAFQFDTDRIKALGSKKGIIPFRDTAAGTSTPISKIVEEVKKKKKMTPMKTESVRDTYNKAAAVIKSFKK